MKLIQISLFYCGFDAVFLKMKGAMNVGKMTRLLRNVEKNVNTQKIKI